VEYKPIWLVFFLLLFFLGWAAALFPRKVIRALRRNASTPEPRFALMFAVLGVLVAVVSAIEVFFIIRFGHML
jgi:hypothetical protein